MKVCLDRAPRPVPTLGGRRVGKRPVAPDEEDGGDEWHGAPTWGPRATREGYGARR